MASYGQSFYAVNPNPKYEVRAVWLTTIGGIDWPHSYAQSERSAEKQKEELRAILDRLQKANINTVLLQTRIPAMTPCSLPSTNATKGAWRCMHG